jgi:hypothetical protein
MMAKKLKKRATPPPPIDLSDESEDGVERRIAAVMAFVEERIGEEREARGTIETQVSEARRLVEAASKVRASPSLDTPLERSWTWTNDLMAGQFRGLVVMTGDPDRFQVSVSPPVKLLVREQMPVDILEIRWDGNVIGRILVGKEKPAKRVAKHKPSPGLKRVRRSLKRRAAEDEAKRRRTWEQADGILSQLKDPE